MVDVDDVFFCLVFRQRYLRFTSLVSFSLALKALTWSKLILVFDIFDVGIDDGRAYFWSLFIILFLFDLGNIKMLRFLTG